MSEVQIDALADEENEPPRAEAQKETIMTEKKRHRRAHGLGSVYLQRPGSKIWWISYRGPDGRRRHESTGSELKKYAETVLRKRIGARDHNLPVVKNVEKLTFDEA